MEFLHIIRMAYLDGYRIELEFNDHSIREVDLKNELYGEVFEPLLDPELFHKGRINPETGTIEWSTGADFAPEYLHEIGKEVVRT